MLTEILVGAPAVVSALAAGYAVVVSRTAREAGTRKTANEAADLITEAAGGIVKQLQEQADRTMERNKELVNALNALTDLLDEVLEAMSRDGAVLGLPNAGCSDRLADKELIARLRLANRAAKIIS